MNRIALIAILLVSMVCPSIARQGYHVRLSMPGVKDSMVYLVHYYGKPLPLIYKQDSARFDKQGTAVLSSDATLTGGIYMLLLSDQKTYFELLLDDGDDMRIAANIKDLPQSIKFSGSPENERFQQYTSFLKDYSAKQQALQKEYGAAKTHADTLELRKKTAIAGKELTTYRRDYIKKYPHTLLASIFNALEVPQVPEGVHYLEDGKTRDTAYAYNYYKAHYWDSFDLQDDRLVNTPIYDAKLGEYINKMVLPWPDSIEKESNMLLAKTKGAKELYKYTLWWLTRNVEDSKIMGMDEVFVYLVENYYMKGEATWLSNEEVARYADRAMKIAPNVIGNLAPDINLPVAGSKKDSRLHDVKARYTLLIFYSPSCGHCLAELPAIDSVYKAVLKKNGVKVYTVATEGKEKAITEFVDSHKLQDWTNTWDPEHVGDWRGKYDVYSTPTVYLLDERKIIRGKRLDHNTIATLVAMLEKKKQQQKTN